MNLVAFGKTKQKLRNALQECYNNMERDLSDHRMVINGGKTQLMIVTKKKDLKTITITADNKTICHQENIKILGITLSASMKFDTHIREDKKAIVKSIYKKISIIRNVKPYVDKATLSRIGDSLIGSTISYGAPIWAQTTAGNLAAIQVAQTKAARMISGLTGWGYRENRTHRQDIMSQLGWKNVYQLIASSNLNLLKLALDNKSAQSVNNMFKQSEPAHSRGSVIIRADHTGKASKATTRFESQATSEFNRLPDRLKSPLLTPKGLKSLRKYQILTIHHASHHKTTDAQRAGAYSTTCAQSQPRYGRLAYGLNTLIKLARHVNQGKEAWLTTLTCHET